MRLSNQRYAWIDTLFALPEAVLYAAWSTTSIATRRPRSPTTDAVRAHPRVHRRGAPRRLAQGDRQRQLLDYVERDEGLAETLHKFRSSGKKLFLLTNSVWDYTTR